MYLFVSFQCRTKLKPRASEQEQRFAAKESLWQATKQALHILFLIPAIIVSMLTGLFSPSEAGAAAVLYILIVEAIKGKFSFKILKDSIIETYKTICNIFIIIGVAAFFTKVLTLTIGMLTPAFGVGLYTVATVGNVPAHKVLRELLPLYVPLIVALLIVTYVPPLTLLLPSLL